MTEFRPEDHTLHEYTLRAEELEDLRKAARASGRHLINRDTNVLNGVWGGDYDAEALVVDYNREKDYYDRLASEFKARVSVAGPDGRLKVDKHLILDGINDFVREKLPYSLRRVEEIYDQLGHRPAQKVSLAYYVQEKAGVCRHQALLAATILELFKKQGLVQGTARVNRNIQWPEAGEPGGHAWVRYTNSAGDVYIIDPAQNFVGSLEKAVARNRGWNYFLPTDPKPPRIIGATAAHKIIQPQDIPKV